MNRRPPCAVFPRARALLLGVALTAAACGGQSGESPAVVTSGSGDAFPTNQAAEPSPGVTLSLATPAPVTAAAVASPADAEAPAGTPAPTGATEAVEAPKARGVGFSSPAPESVVASPAEVCLAHQGVELVPSSAPPEPGTGHLLVLVDPSPQEVGMSSLPNAAPIPSGERFVHFDDGQACRTLELSPGKHVLVGLLVDSVGMPLNPQATDRLQLTVDGP